MSASLADPPGEHIACSSCGTVLPAWRMIRSHSGWLCRDCHATETAALPSSTASSSKYHVNNAGFWIRLLARIIDLICIGALAFGAAMAIIYLQAKTEWIYLSIAIIPLLYFTLTVGSSSTTPGKRLCGLSLAGPSGYRVGYLRAFWRVLAENIGLAAGAFLVLFFFNPEEISQLDLRSPLWLAILPVALFTYFLILINPSKRALHDYLAGTRVVKG